MFFLYNFVSFDSLVFTLTHVHIRTSSLASLWNKVLTHKNVYLSIPRQWSVEINVVSSVFLLKTVPVGTFLHYRSC